MLAILTIGGIISLFINLALGLFVYSRNASRAVNKYFALFSVSIAIWSAGSFLANAGIGPELGLLTLRICYITAAFLPVFYLHFTFHILDQFKKRKKTVAFLYLISFSLSLTLGSSFFIAGLRSIENYNFFVSVPGPIYYLFFIFMTICTLFGLYLVGKKIGESQGQLKTRLLWMFIAQLIAQVAGFEYFSAVFKWWDHIPCDDYILIGHFVIMSYAILKHQLLDIEVIIKKTLVFAGLFAMVIGVVSAVTTIIQAILVKFIAVPQTISMTVSILIAMTLYDPTRKFLVNVTDKYLFQKKESFGVILNRLSQEIVTILDISEVAKTILKNLEQTIRLESGALFIKNEKGSEYEIFDSFGLQDTKQKIDKNDALVKYLLTERRLVNLENANVLKTIPFQIHDTLKILKTHECLPLIILDDLIGFLILGKKKSDQDFSQDEIDYFPTLASQIALALRNARAVAIEKRTQLELAQQSKLAALGTLTAGIGHEINNPLNNISGVLGMLLFNLKAGAYDPMGKEELVKEIKEVTQKAMENVHRTSDVIKRLSMFSKKPKDFKTEEVNLEEAIEEALKNVKNQLENNNIMVKKQYWKNPLVVLADFGSIVQSLVAIFINAVHAMGTSGMLTVSTAIRENKVDLMIKDTGSGISKEIQDKIFDPFFTTKDTSRNPDEKATTGSGLGLYVVRLLMNMCGGDIKVESEVGKGTAFILSFPIHKK